MDERFRGKGLWVGLGVLAIIFLCVMMCGVGAMFAGPRSAVYVQPPVAEEGVTAPPPPPAFYGHGPAGVSRYGAVGGPFGFILGAIGALFKLAFFGLLLLLGLGLAKRLFFGHRCWGPPPGWRPPPGWKQPEGKEGEGRSYATWGPRGWHRHHKHWGPPPWWEAPSEPDAEDDEPGEQYGVED